MISVAAAPPRFIGAFAAEAHSVELNRCAGEALSVK